MSRIGSDTDRLFVWVGLGLFVGGVMYLVYLAIEPFVRKSCPTMLIGWSRAMGGRFRDAVIGRDLVVGTVAGTLLLALDQINALVRHLIGRPDPIPFRPDTGMLEHPRYFVVTMTSGFNTGLQNALLSVLVFTIFRELFKRLTARLKARWAGSDYTAAGFALAIATLIQVATTESPDALAVAQFILTSLVFLVVLLRYGLLAVVVMYTISSMLSRTPLTLRGDSLYALPAWLMVGVIFVAAAAGVWLARGGEPLFERAADA
jgi:serine/threonine-protein kinase